MTSVGEQADRPEHIRQVAVSLLASEWHRLPGTHRRLALTADHADWSAALADLLQQRESPCPASAALFVDLGPAAPPSALIRLIAAADRASADTAERLLIDRASHLFAAPPDELPPRLLQRSAETPGPRRLHGEAARRPSPAETASLVRAMLDAQETHERSTPALIALAMLDRPALDPLQAQLAPLLAVLDDPDHPAAPTLRRLIRRDRSVMSRRLAWRLLSHPALGMPALERVAGASTPAEHEALLTNAHLVLHPARRRALAMLPTPREAGARTVRTPTPVPANPAELSVEARRGLARLAPALDIGPAVEPDAVHHAALVEPDRLARLMHARVAVGGQLADFCFDQDPAIARSAVLRWSAAGVSGQRAVPAHRARLASLLTRSPHRAVRRLAIDEPSATPPQLDTPRGRFTELLEAKPDRPLGDHLQDELMRSDDPGRRVALIGLAARTGVLDGWRDLLDEMTQPGKAGPLVSATIATALRTLPAPFPKDILSRLLAHADPRVRANAVETLDRLLRKGVAPENARAAIYEAKASGEHRSRANAVRAETGKPTGDPLDSAGADLERMITDERPPHRLAGAWLAERVLCAPGMDRTSPAWQRAALRVARVARDEPDAHIRARAKRCARRLLTAVDGPAVPVSRPDPAESAARAALERFAAQGSAGLTEASVAEAGTATSIRGRAGATEGVNG